ncbi:MAG: DUF4325 domain-containing protein [Candidatus Moranbacteria bacterium]|nr:DUF4325 domain-containing protein [Candidatus Moranbacteria bacterium]
MKIELRKFGSMLISRQAGREAFAAFKPSLENIKENELVEVDFEGVSTFSPSWGDEFLRPLHEKFNDKLWLLESRNPSVKLTLELLEEVNKTKFNIKK